MNEDTKTETFQNIPINFEGKLVVTTRTTERIDYEEDGDGKSSSVMEVETVTTYEHIKE